MSRSMLRRVMSRLVSLRASRSSRTSVIGLGASNCGVSPCGMAAAARAAAVTPREITPPMLATKSKTQRHAGGATAGGHCGGLPDRGPILVLRHPNKRRPTGARDPALDGKRLHATLGELPRQELVRPGCRSYRLGRSPLCDPDRLPVAPPGVRQPPHFKLQNLVKSPIEGDWDRWR
jgi:hypothetical protein